jgi:hypothetical protein
MSNSKPDIRSGAAIAYDARAAWDYETLDQRFRTKITRAVFHDDTILIDWPPENGKMASTVLRKGSGSRYTGRTLTGAGTPQEETSAVEAVLYSNEIGHVLIGQETWASWNDWFVVQFANGTELHDDQH